MAFSSLGRLVAWSLGYFGPTSTWVAIPHFGLWEGSTSSFAIMMPWRSHHAGPRARTPFRGSALLLREADTPRQELGAPRVYVWSCGHDAASILYVVVPQAVRDSILSEGYRPSRRRCVPAARRWFGIAAASGGSHPLISGGSGLLERNLNANAT